MGLSQAVSVATPVRLRSDETLTGAHPASVDQAPAAVVAANDGTARQAVFGVPEQVGALNAATVQVGPNDPNRLVMDLFEAREDLPGIAIVQDGAPTGLINRASFFAKFARPYARELFLNRACVTFAELSPLILDEATSISDAGARIAAMGEQVLADGFIITRDGRFQGLCDGATFVRALADLLSDQHRRLLSSIDYASTIQTAMLADSRAALETGFAQAHELVWQPRDVVGGDCFFAAHSDEGILVGLMDCTGHGVPGALLTSIAISEASRLSADPEIRQSPASVLAHLSRRMKAALQQHKPFSDARCQADDGLDAIFLWAGAGASTVRVASAKLPILILDDAGVLTTVKGDRKGLGYRDTPVDFVWTDHEIPLATLRRIIMATDGVCDQIGGDKGLGFGWSGIRRSLEATQGLDLAGQVSGLWSAFERHQAHESRRDDVTILGLEFGRTNLLLAGA